MLDVQAEVIAAEARIRKYIRYTPLDYSIPLSKLTGTKTYFKCENLQLTGSFKARGAFNKILWMTPEQRAQGVVAASSGNHGAAVAFGLSHFKIPGVIFVPETASPTKIENIRNYEAHLEFYAQDYMHTELHAREYAKEYKRIYISPYNDAQVIGGQGTIGLELMQQLEGIDVVLVAVGGGGLISGIAGYIKALSPKTQVYGCMPENSPVMAESIKAGHIVQMKMLPTLSDATYGGIAPNAISFELCQKYVDGYFLVTETEIKEALVRLIKTQHMLAEGASGVALASLLKHAPQFQGKKVVVILSGANISVPNLKTVLEQEV